MIASTFDSESGFSIRPSSNTADSTEIGALCRRNDASISSRVLPLVSGMKKAQTTTVSRAAPPKKKYTPYVECARKIGVVKAIIQLTTCMRYHEHIVKPGKEGVRLTQFALNARLAAPALVCGL